MEFKSLRNIETSFRQIRLFLLVFAGLCALTTGVVVWNSFRFAEAQRQKIYVLDKGKSLMVALSQDMAQNRPVEAREHVRRFHELFFTLSPDKVAIEGNVRRALFLCDESAFRYYKDWQDFNRYPYQMKTYARQYLTRASNITERSLVTRCSLINSGRSDNNPHGFMMEQFTILENRDLRTVER